MAKTQPKAVSSPKSPACPPVVVVMGHVDHGKTTLLEAIREYGAPHKPSSLTAQEQGGITQQIGAYQVEVPLKEEPKSRESKTNRGIPRQDFDDELSRIARDDFATRKITFLDTPGHEAFGQMRARGAQVADLAILVVAANDGVKPQTKEAIAHIKTAHIPFVVAINKIDLPEASVDKVKGQLAEAEVLVEGYGGDVVSAPISAKEKKGIDQLLELVLLVGQMEELKGRPENQLKAYVIETFLDPHRGVIANVVVKDGQLRPGDEIVAQIENRPQALSAAEGKVKALLDENGKRLVRVTPGQPAQVLGFKTMPLVGALVSHKTGEKAPVVSRVDQQEEVQPRPPVSEIPQLPVSSHRNKHVRDDSDALKSLALESSEPAGAGEAPQTKKEEKKKIILVLKADTQGSLEAIRANLTEEVELVGEGVGEISDSDILLARSTGAVVIGFQVRLPSGVAKLAEMEQVKVTTYTVIYHLLEAIQKQVLKLIEPTIDEEVLGKAEVIAEFTIKGNHIAGCKVKEGKIHKSYRIRVKRGETIVGEARIAAMQKEREETTTVKRGDEVGLVFRPDLTFQVGDEVVAFQVA